MTVCGLTTVNMSMLTGWQQAMLFILMCIGNPIFVSWVVVLQRRHFFSIKFKHVLHASAEKRTNDASASSTRTWSNRFSSFLKKSGAHVGVAEASRTLDRDAKKDKKNPAQKLTPDMIRRVDDEPKLINPSGHAVPPKKLPTAHIANPGHLSFAPSTWDHGQHHASSRRNPIESEGEEKDGTQLRPSSDPETYSRHSTLDTDEHPPPQPPLQTGDPTPNFTRSQTIEFAPNVMRRRNKTLDDHAEEDRTSSPSPDAVMADQRSLRSRRASFSSQGAARGLPKSSKHSEFGGFPMPWTIIGGLFSRLFPKIQRRLTRTVTIPATMSYVSQHNTAVPPGGGKAVSYISFNATVGRNSAFQGLTHEEMDELGGVEYRALNALLWIIGGSSRANETLHFLLDHPRRCFIFLFPSHQTWFLLTVVFGLTYAAMFYPGAKKHLVDQRICSMTDWFFFLVLDIGNPTTEAIPVGTRVLVGLFQGIAVRSAGFSAVNVAGLAAAVNVRSTNVYEEQSLGIFRQDEDEDEADFIPSNHRVTTWTRYLALHARKQLAFVFDIVSAYGTVGLSLGTPNDNFSFAGELKSLSKFILCLVMIRGRHRILPVAIDRAVMLPSELQRQLDQHLDSRSLHAPQDDDPNQRRHSTIQSTLQENIPKDVDGRPS
ncbi:hypothetical protein H0H93_007479 [Arthromyces matolae]|nr:hypothetical protein H0H93_007479 [Arthromyces matolae]